MPAGTVKSPSRCPAFLALGARRRRELAFFALEALRGTAARRSHAPFVWAMLAGLPFAAARPGFAVSFVLFGCLALAGLFDARHFIIPDVQSGVLGLLGLAQGLAFDAAAVPDRLIACAAAFCALRGIDLAYLSWRGHAGPGAGDAKLPAAGGLWLGLAGLPACLLWASLSGLAAVLVLLAGGTVLSPRTAIPFGPHLCLGIWLVWLFGPLVA